MLATLQVPNPPARFVGRTTEIKWLRAAIERAPVTVVAGEGGLGKSALALFTLHARFSERIGGAIWMSLRDADPHEPVALGLLRALVRAGGLERFHWAELLAAPESLAAVAVSLAETQRRWIVIEDLHHGDPAQVDALLGHAARYAKESRLLVTTRRAPADEALLGQVLTLGAMSDRDLARLARAIDPAARRDAIHDAVARAHGSPWQLRRAQTTSAEEAPRDDRARASSDLLDVLRLIPIPMAEAALARIVAVPPGDLEALDRQGLLEHRAEGVRLHEVAEDMVPAMSNGPRRRSLGARAASVLAKSGDTAAQLTALRLLFGASALDAALAVLDAALPVLLDVGYAPALFRLLEGVADPRFERARLRCAVELGDAAVLARVGRPADPDLDTQLLWVRVLYAKGQLPETMEAAEEVRAAAAAKALREVAFQAGLLGALATANHVGVPEALALLDALEPESELSSALREGYRATAYAVLCRRDEALAAVGAAAPRLAALVWPARGQVGALIARALLRLGRLREAAAMLDAALAEGPQGSPRFDVGRSIRFTRAALALDSGELDRVRADLDILEPYLGAASLFSPFARQARVTAAIAGGDLARIDERIATAVSQESAVLMRESNVDRLRLAILRREPFQGPEDISVVSIFGDAYRIYRVDQRVRAAEIEPREALAELADLPEQPELRMIVHRARAAAHLVAGSNGEAADEIHAAISTARDAGYRVALAEALEIAADVHVIAGTPAPLAEIADELAALAKSMPSARFACASRFVREVAIGPPDPAVLEAIAGASFVAPPYAIRARALLGAAVRGDAVDRLVLAALSRCASRRVPETSSFDGSDPFEEPWRPGWGIDESACAVWLPDGARVPFSRGEVAWKILMALVAGGGRALKEDIVAAVWRERDYHPLRHDNRLHVAVRALRARVEGGHDGGSPIPPKPSRIVTVEGGYALGGVVRVLRLGRVSH